MSYLYVEPAVFHGNKRFANNVDVDGNLNVDGTSVLIGGVTIETLTLDTNSANALLIRRDGGGATVLNVDNTAQSVEIGDADIVFETGRAATATRYSTGRNADATNLYYFNVPTGASFEWTVNDVTEMTLSATAVNFQNNSITTTGGGSLTGTWSDLGTVTTIDINGGTLDGTIIGGASAAAATITTLSMNNLITWSAGAAITAASYQIGRDADGTNQLHLNVPTGGTFEFSVNDIAEMVLSATQLNLQNNTLLVNAINSTSTTTSITMQNQTFASIGADHQALIVQPTWSAENFNHDVLFLNGTQNGGVSGSFSGLRIALTKGTAATTADNFYSINILAPTVTGTVSIGRAIFIADQTVAGITTSRGIEFNATGVANSILWGGSALQYANAANNIRFMDATNVNGLAFNLLATAVQTINTVTATTGNITLQNQTFTAGAAHNAITMSPTWATENFAHTSLNLTATQNGANSSTLTGINVTMTKATVATTLATSTAINISAISVTGVITNSYGLDIANQSPSGGTTAYGIRIQSQTANATTTRALEVVGTGVNNAIRLGASANFYAPTAETFRYTDSTDVNGLVFVMDAGATQAIQTVTTTTGTLRLQGQTFTPGAGHSAINIPIVWASENFNHTAMSFTATQNGANTQALTAIGISMVKATGATTLASMTGITILAPTVTGTVTTSTAISIGNQTNAGITTARAITILGTGASNAIVLGSSPLVYSSGAEVIVFGDSTAVSGLSFTLTAASNQTITTTTGDLLLSIAGGNLAPTANDGWALGISGTGISDIFLASGAVINFNAGDVTITHAADALTLAGAISLTMTQAAATTGNPAGFSFTGAAHTTLSAGGETNDIYINLARTVQYATGSLATQRSFLVERPTHAFVGASTITRADTFAINGGPTAGTNATITESSALRIQTLATTADEIRGITIESQNIANGLVAVTTLTGLHVTTSGGSTVSLGNQTATLTNYNLIRLDSLTLVSTTNTRTVTNPATLYVGNAPIAGTNVTFSNGPYALWVDAGKVRFDGAGTVLHVSAAGAALELQASTIAGTNASSTIAIGSTVSLGISTFTNATATLTMTDVASLYIAGVPVASTNVAFTNAALALWVDAGLTRLDGGVTFAGSGQSTLSNYTEGTFTPTVTLVGGAGNTVPVYSTNTGRYTQTGRIVYVDVYLTGDGGAEGAGTGVFNVALPVTASASNPTSYFPCGIFVNGTAEDPVWGQITAGGTTISLVYEDVLNNLLDMTGAEQSSTTRTVRLKFFYEV